MYRKRPGLYGYRGPLYEIKLICLMYFRAFHDDTLEEFQIASNVDEMEDFDDICFTAKVKERDKPVAVFLKLKHTESEKRMFVSDFTKYFHSYVRIRQKFDRSYKNSLLNGAFDDTECFFVIYTNALTDPRYDTLCESDFSAKLNNLIRTGGSVTQPAIGRENVKLLCEVAVKEQIIYLAKRMVKFNYNDIQTLLNDEIFLRFHVILAREVFDVSEIQPDGHRIAIFRDDFLDIDTHNEYLSILHDAFFKEILIRTKIESTNLEHLLSEFLTEPTDALKLSKLIGIGITCNNGHFQLGEHIGIPKNYRLFMKQIEVSRSTERLAVKLAAREKLSNLQFKVPAAFGNKDLTIRSKDAKVVKRINYLATKIVDLIEKFKPAIEITVDDSVEQGLLQLNGGIAGAIGNIFVLDDSTKLMKITDSCEDLGPFSKMLYCELICKIHNLHEYRFCFKFNICPKLSFDFSQYEENLAIGFMNRLLIYSDQADESTIEQILKMEIEHYQSDHANIFEAITDAVFARYFCLMLNWWMKPRSAEFLTRQFNLFRKSTNNIIKYPLTSSINLTYKSKIIKYNYTFTADAVSSLKLENHITTVIITENSLASVVKVMQQLKNNVVLDFVHIADLPTKDFDNLCSELKNINYCKVLILVCDEIKQENDKTNSRNDIYRLDRIAEAVDNRRIITVTNQKTYKILKNVFPRADKIYQDKKLRLIDLHEESQMSIFEKATAIFPGVEIPLDELLRDWPQPGSRSAGAAAAAAAAERASGSGSRPTGM